VTLRWIIEEGHRRRIETILHVGLMFQFDHACFQRGEDSANIGVSNNMSYVSNADICPRV